MNKIQTINGSSIEELGKIDIDFSTVIFVSDPPFNIDYHYATYKDRMEEGEYYDFLKNIFGVNKQVIVHYPECLYKHSFNIGLFPEKVFRLTHLVLLLLYQFFLSCFELQHRLAVLNSLE